MSESQKGFSRGNLSKGYDQSSLYNSDLTKQKCRISVQPVVPSNLIGPTKYQVQLFPFYGDIPIYGNIPTVFQIGVGHRPLADKN